MISWLLLGFAMGVRHALEADHVAAVASLSARAASRVELIRVAGAWGIGHALTILAVALVWVVTGLALSDTAEMAAEAAAGGLLVWLGVDLLRSRPGTRASVHPHRHRDGARHVHLHWHASEAQAAEESHPHVAHPLRRALLVGSLHGLAGSALLGLLAANGSLPVRALSFAVLFGLGATAGMLALSTVISLPLRLERVRGIVFGRAARFALAVGTIAIGLWIGAQALLPIAASASGFPM